MTGPDRQRPSLWVRAFALALLLFVVLRFAAPALRPSYRGMAEDPCPKSAPGPLTPAADWLRRLAGERPEFDHWTGHCVYAQANAAIHREGRAVDVVFIGDSITSNWQAADAQLFAGRQANRGITGQSAAQVLARFYADVVALKPRAVHLLIGTNDVAGTHGPVNPQTLQDTTRAMVDIAGANGIAVIIGTLPPMTENPFDRDHRPAPVIAAHNRWLAQFAQENRLILADYHAALSDSNGGFKPGMGVDEFHPSPAGYAAMRPVLDKALAEALAAPKT